MKLFLHGWLTSLRTEKNKKFFQEVVKFWWNKILIFPFAQKDKNYELQFELDSQKFIDHNTDIDIECVMASDDIEVLVDQIKKYNLLYFCGGTTKYHIEIMDKLSDYADLFSDKIISWSSAGALMWAEYYYDQDFEKVMEWLGLFEIKLICHWGTKYYPDKLDADRLNDLENYKENLPIYKIEEQEYEMFEI